VGAGGFDARSATHGGFRVAGANGGIREVERVSGLISRTKKFEVA
jgi:hypothetical protein